MGLVLFFCRHFIKAFCNLEIASLEKKQEIRLNLADDRRNINRATSNWCFEVELGFLKRGRDRDVDYMF